MRLSYVNHWSTMIHPQIFQDYVQSFLGDSVNVMICRDDYEELKLNQTVNWIGDLMFESYDQFIKQFMKFHVEHLDVGIRDQINRLQTQLLNQVQQSLFLTNVPLKANQNLKMENVFKLFNIGVDDGLIGDYYGIIEMFVKIQLEINPNLCLVFVNLHHVLVNSQLQLLTTLCKNSEIGIIDLEFDNVSNHKNYGANHMIFVDHDYVDWEFNNV